MSGLGAIRPHADVEWWVFDPVYSMTRVTVIRFVDVMEADRFLPKSRGFLVISVHVHVRRKGKEHEAYSPFCGRTLSAFERAQAITLGGTAAVNSLKEEKHQGLLPF